MDQLPGPSVSREKQNLLLRGRVQKESGWVQALLLSPHTSSPETSHNLVHSAIEGCSKFNLHFGKKGSVSVFPDTM